MILHLTGLRSTVARYGGAQIWNNKLRKQLSLDCNWWACTMHHKKSTNWHHTSLKNWKPQMSVWTSSNCKTCTCTGKVRQAGLLGSAWILTDSLALILSADGPQLDSVKNNLREEIQGKKKHIGRKNSICTVLP